MTNGPDRVTVYAGTDTDLLIVLSLDTNNGSVIDIKEIVNAPNPKVLKMGAPGGITTEWLALHPSKQLLYAMTSYWSHDLATIVTYKVLEDGALERLGSTSTQGYQACHAVFSPNKRFLVVAHYIQGRISVFDTYSSELLGEPVGAIDCYLPGPQAPTVEEAGKKHKGPLAHGLAFSPDGKYLIACDAGQAQLVVYSFDSDTGRIEEKSTRKCQLSAKSHGWMNVLLTCYLGIRPRHAAVHPSGHFVFVVYETMNTLTWHRFEADGSIGEALGEVPSIDPTLKNAWFVGMSLNLAAEISCTDTHVYVSNRGKALLLGKAENSIAVFEFDMDTATLTQTCRAHQDGIARHFINAPTSLMTASQDEGDVYLYKKRDGGELKLQTKSHVGFPITCLASRDGI